MRTLTVSIAAAVLATAAVAIAAPGMGQRGPAGDMTRAQAEAMAAQRFAKMDANGDGKLDASDRTAMQAKMFDRIDANHDGMISRDEFAAMHAGRRAGAPGMGHDRAGMTGDGGAMHGHRMHAGKMRGMMGKMADGNGNGAISQAEFTAAAVKRFDMADANHDGTVTQAERQAAHAAMRAKWQQRKDQRAARVQTQGSGN